MLAGTASALLGLQDHGQDQDRGDLLQLAIEALMVGARCLRWGAAPAPLLQAQPGCHSANALLAHLPWGPARCGRCKQFY